MEMEKLIERFVKDNNLSIKTYCGEAYFVKSLASHDNLLGTHYVEKWNTLKELIEERFKGNIEAYFAEYTKVKEAAMAAIKADKAFQEFNNGEKDFLEKGKLCSSTPDTSVYKDSNKGKYFISFDIKKANYSILKANGVFEGIESWEQFLMQFTDIREIIESKYIRQVILGNCNPKRQVAAEKAHMIKFEGKIRELFDFNKIPYTIYSLTNDEIVVELLSIDAEILTDIINTCTTLCAYSMREMQVPIRYDVYKLIRISFQDETESKFEKAYCRKFIAGETSERVDIKPYDFKCVDKMTYPLIYAAYECRFLHQEDFMINTQYGKAWLNTLPKLNTDWLKEIK